MGHQLTRPREQREAVIVVDRAGAAVLAQQRVQPFHAIAVFTGRRVIPAAVVSPRARHHRVRRELRHRVLADEREHFGFGRRGPQPPREAAQRSERLENRGRASRQGCRVKLRDGEPEQRGTLGGVHHQGVSNPREDGRGDAR
jgi:hypothetical protein